MRVNLLLVIVKAVDEAHKFGAPKKKNTAKLTFLFVVGNL